MVEVSPRCWILRETRVFKSRNLEFEYEETDALLILVTFPGPSSVF